MKCHERRSAAPVLDNGIGLLRFKKNTYEADKALERILEVSDVPLVAKPIYGRQVQVATLLGKDAKGEAATFTATMQPPIEPGEEMEIYISCRDLVQMWIVKMFGQAPSKAAPSPYVLVKEKLENGKWVEIGRTESIAKDCNPVFSRPVLVTYKGPEAAQQIQINVLSHAFKMRNGMPFGQCTFLLDDLVHARTARVLKLPLLGTAKNKSNGSVIVTGARHEPAEAGMWVQIKLCALHLPWYAEPWYNAAGELNFEARKENTSKIPPNVYFEVWRQSNEGEKPVYRSEVVKGSDPDWCPVALNSRVCAGEDECFWLKLWNQRTSNANETTSSDLLGECRINMHELLARKEFPIFEKWPDKTLAKNSKGQPKFLIQESKWIKLANEAKLECQPVYKKDMDFLKDLMDNLDLDAATKESCQSCLLFVNTRAKFWATEKILSESVKIGAHPIHHDDSFHPSSQSQSVAGAADDTNACSRNESKAARRGSLSLSRQDSKQHSESFMQELPPNAAAYAENYDTAKKFLEEHTPISRRQQSKIWLEELENIQNRCKSRTWSTTRPRSPDAAMGIAVSRLRLGGDVVSSEDGVEGLTPRTRSCSSPFKDTLRPERKSATSAGNRRHSQARRGSIVSDLTDSLDLHNRSLLSSSVDELEDGQSKALGVIKEGRGGGVGGVPPLHMDALRDTGGDVRDVKTARPKKDSSIFSTHDQKQRPSTARPYTGRAGEERQKRTTWRPFSARSRLSRPLSARSLLSARSDFRNDSALSRMTTPVEATALFRESIRPLLANVMRQGSESQHPSAIKPVSVCSLTPSGNFRFSNKYI